MFQDLHEERFLGEEVDISFSRSPNATYNF